MDFPSNVKVKTCQLSASENHKQKYFRKPMQVILFSENLLLEDKNNFL